MTSEYRIVQLLKELKDLIVGQPKQDRWMNINEASEYTSISPSSLRRNFHNGHLSGSKKLNKLLFKESELERFLNS